MSDIDRQRIQAVQKLQHLGLAWHLGEWRDVANTEFVYEADAMHAMLVRRADNLAGCLEGSSEEAELASIVAAMEAYEQKRWPLGKEPGGKG